MFPASSRPSRTVIRVRGLCSLLSDRNWMFMSLSATPSPRAASLTPLVEMKPSALGQFIYPLDQPDNQIYLDLDKHITSSLLLGL